MDIFRVNVFTSPFHFPPFFTHPLLFFPFFPLFFHLFFSLFPILSLFFLFFSFFLPAFFTVFPFSPSQCFSFFSFQEDGGGSSDRGAAGSNRKNRGAQKIIRRGGQKKSEVAFGGRRVRRTSPKVVKSKLDQKKVVQTVVQKVAFPNFCTSFCTTFCTSFAKLCFAIALLKFTFTTFLQPGAGVAFGMQLFLQCVQNLRSKRNFCYKVSKSCEVPGGPRRRLS